MEQVRSHDPKMFHLQVRVCVSVCVCVDVTHMAQETELVIFPPEASVVGTR